MVGNWVAPSVDRRAVSKADPLAAGKAAHSAEKTAATWVGRLVGPLAASTAERWDVLKAVLLESRTVEHSVCWSVVWRAEMRAGLLVEHSADGSADHWVAWLVGVTVASWADWRVANLAAMLAVCSVAPRVDYWAEPKAVCWELHLAAMLAALSVDGTEHWTVERWAALLVAHWVCKKAGLRAEPRVLRTAVQTD